MLPRLNPRYRTLTAICASLTALIAILSYEGWFIGLADRASRDWLLTNSEAKRCPQDPRIVFLAIDDESTSLETIFADELAKSPTLQMMKNGFPFNRAVYADIADRLIGSGAKAVLFDMVFPGPRDGDHEFRAALDKYGDHLVIGTKFATVEEEEHQGSTVSSTPKHILPTPELLPPPGRPSWLGFVNVRPDEDGLVRRVTYRTTLTEFFGVPATDNSKEVVSLAARGLEKAGFADKIPRTHDAVMFRFAEPFRSRSLHEIFVEERWKSAPYNSGEFFRGKIVLIGSTGQSSEDRMQTPFGVIVGPQIHLNALNAALNNDFVRETTPAFDLGLVLGGGTIAWMLGAWVRRPVLRILALGLLVVAFQQGTQFLANEVGIVPFFLSPLLALTTSGITWAAWEQVADRLERQRTRGALERYVGHDVAREVLDNPASYLDSLGGKRKEVTILFSDIRGFTTLTESADAHQLVTQLNEYFTEMVAIVFAQQGTLDKFIGDAVMAHWGGIVSAGAETDAVRAVTTALEMCEALKKLNADWKTRGITEWAIGIGLNHGAPITGNIGASGARKRFDFTVVGDAVNLASRLEGTTKNYHIELCIGESVAALVRKQFPLRSVDLIIVKGKTKPVEIFTVLGKQGAPAPTWLPVHDEAMRCYRAGDFAAAEAAWRHVLEQVPGDGLTEVMLARCVELQKFPPPAPWTGVYEMKSK